MMHQHYYNGRPHNYKWMTSIIYIYRYMTLCLEGVVSPRSRCRVSCRHGRTAACRVAVVAPPPVVLLPMPSCCRVLCHVAFAAHRAVATLLLLASPLRGECWDWCVQPIHRT